MTSTGLAETADWPLTSLTSEAVFLSLHSFIGFSSCSSSQGYFCFSSCSYNWSFPCFFLLFFCVSVRLKDVFFPDFGLTLALICFFTPLLDRKFHNLVAI